MSSWRSCTRYRQLKFPFVYPCLREEQMMVQRNLFCNNLTKKILEDFNYTVRASLGRFVGQFSMCKKLLTRAVSSFSLINL
mmetsp:Transcript_14565/g.40471  ORF Transcript_14565/g.40471 Transcript_14565/m.40471 type:complete len:81 (-) Transcript_14565:1791-2033(-)